MKKTTVVDSILLWVRSRQKLLMIQRGTGDNLLREDIDNGYVDYVLYSVFEFGEIGIDQELDLELVDSGQMLLTSVCEDVRSEIPGVYRMAFDTREWDNDDVVVLKKNEEAVHGK